MPPETMLSKLLNWPLSKTIRGALPVNRPQCPVHTYNKDGAMRFDGNDGSAVNYEPNSVGGADAGAFLRGAAAPRQRHRSAARPSQR